MITVKEYADHNGVTAQSVYKRINSKKLKEENTRLKDELIAKQNKYENVLEQLLIAQKQIAEKDKQLLEYQNTEKETREPDKTEPENQNEVKKGNWFTRLFKR